MGKNKKKGGVKVDEAPPPPPKVVEEESDSESEPELEPEDDYMGEDMDDEAVVESLFWGMTLSPGAPETIAVEDNEELTIQMASLTSSLKDPKGRSVLQVKIGGETFSLGVLLAGVCESIPLSISFSDEEELIFSVTGKNDVCFTGNLAVRIDSAALEAMDGLDEDEDESGEEGTAPTGGAEDEEEEGGGEEDEDEDEEEDEDDEEEEEEEEVTPVKVTPAKRGNSSKGATPANKVGDEPSSKKKRRRSKGGKN
eukprot:CAMPEP_0182444590 /NCGR_PEP_ID=MMETSP1172-20130603/3001_1 /TAXON_ID=708627 /ORGANISM="Timspurckia oligopyrenoides, Strain CCMP3278" /LENGTH=253 /DNA_ID=CAMNT_0024640187 /DNA_START=46 /DNA_END=807 /DNA_ORIENTATION=-